MRLKFFYSAAALLLAALATPANASTFHITFNGSGTSGDLVVTYGAATDSTYSQAFEITGISGTFSDANIGISNANIIGLDLIDHATPEATNLLAPHDFSKYMVLAGTMDGSLSFDNLLWPGGSPQTATDYPFHGGFLDIYGLLFSIQGGDVVNLWSNGIVPGGTTLPDYGVAVATNASVLDYQSGVAITPEPGSLCLLGTGTLAVAALFRRRLSAMRK